MILGDDIGYGYTKIFSGDLSNDKGEVFQTAVSKYIPKATFGDDPLVMTVNGEFFSVGDTAVKEGKLINTRRKDFVGSNAYLAVLGYSIITAGGNADIIVLGLPPGQYSKEHAADIIRIIKSAEIVFNTKSKPIIIPPIIKFIPQGAGIFFSHVRNGNSVDFQLRTVIIDIGQYTFDMLFFNRGKYVEGFAKSYPYGVFEIYEQIKERFYKEHKVFLKTNESVDLLIKLGEVEIAGLKHSLDVSDIVDLYNSKLGSAIEEYVENLPDEVDSVVCGGGGVKFIRPDITKYRLKYVQYSQLANAKGYFEYGKHFI